jgi:hypothetical protein
MDDSIVLLSVEEGDLVIELIVSGEQLDAVRSGATNVLLASPLVRIQKA